MIHRYILYNRPDFFGCKTLDLTAQTRYLPISTYEKDSVDMNDMTESIPGLYARLDAGIDAWKNGYRLLGGSLFCGKGCSGCCNLAVNSTFPEALFLSESLTDTAAGKLAGHVIRLKSSIPGLTDLRSYLNRHRKELGPCPFLETDGSCAVYQTRPGACRSLIATKESRWCDQDFCSLDSREKHDFMNSLDQSIVAFPLHYAAAPQEMARDVETRLAEAMHERFGYTLYGNLPLLVHMEIKYQMSSRLSEGRQAIEDLLDHEGVNHPFLVILSDSSTT